MAIGTRVDLANSPDVARINHHRYVSIAEGSSQPMPGQIEEMIIRPNTWTRFWSVLDFDQGTDSQWVADENTPPVQLFDKLPIVYSADVTSGIDGFWFEFDSSQDHTGATIYSWRRNFAVLKNLTDDPSYYVQVGVQVAAEINCKFPKPPLLLAP
jgi:hypothetical protein